MTIEPILNKLQSFGSPNGPASADSLASLQEQYPSLPADYIAFLTVHDGWADFGDDEYDLLAASGEGYLQDRDIYAETFHDQADFDEWVLEVRESAILLGGQMRMWVVFIPETGEVVEYAEGEREATHESFTAFLQSAIA